MDFRRPVEALIPGVQGRVLEVMTRTSADLNLRTIARLAAVSPAQAGRVLAGLVELGVVERREAPPSSLFRLVPDHVATRALYRLAEVREVACAELQRAAAAMHPTPRSVILFGSFARGEADARSDIDVVIVRPSGVDGDDEEWAEALRAWAAVTARVAGNRVEILEVGADEIGGKLAGRSPLWRAVRLEGEVVFGSSLVELAGTGRA